MMALLLRNSTDAASKADNNFCSLGSQFTDFKGQVVRELAQNAAAIEQARTDLPAIIEKEVEKKLGGVNLTGLPQLISDEVAKQIQGSSMATTDVGGSSHAMGGSSLAAMDAAAASALDFRPAFVEVASIVPFGSVKTHGASTQECRTYGLELLAGLSGHARALFASEPRDAVRTKPRFEPHSGMELWSKERMLQPQVSLVVAELAIIDKSKPFRPGTIPKIFVQKPPLEQKRDDDLRVVKAIFKSHFDGRAELQCRYKQCRVVVVRPDSPAYPLQTEVIGGIDKDGRVFHLVATCIRYGFQKLNAMI